MSNSERPMRRSALIGPWGVGAIVPFPNDESLMIAGLDAWRYSDAASFTIEDERLRKRLNVEELRWPPDYRERNSDPQNCHLTIPAVRFPTWHYCPFCGTMRQSSLYEPHPECDAYQWPNGRKCNPTHWRKRKLVPERFIVICADGHVDDFPIAEWVHHDSGRSYDPRSCRIRRSTGGASASLSGVFYECSCGARKSLAGALGKNALEKRIGYHCSGSRPWLGEIGDGSTCSCGAEARVVLRGATNVWFADSRSSIYIPLDGDLENEKILACLDESFDLLANRLVDGKPDKATCDMIAQMKRIDPEAFYEAFLARLENSEGLEDVSEEMSEDEYRLAEYMVLRKNSGSGSQAFHSCRYSIGAFDESLAGLFAGISMVHKLKETRAFVGFSRLEPKQDTIENRKKMLRLGEEKWLPAIQVHGEGIFFEFDETELKKWAERPKVQERIAILRENCSASKFGEGIEGDLRPEFVLIHTFAHLLINQMSFECGYGSSSIRERIYCEKGSDDLGMCGVLIYTASGDSEGSLGGLVRQGEPGRIEDTVFAAMQNAAWCSSDPVCIQSLGQGPESCNLAACHNCALLPETCCECGNRLLDRGLVVGTPDDRELGFFSKLIE